MALGPGDVTLVRASRAQEEQAIANEYPQWGAPRGVPTVDAFIAQGLDLMSSTPNRPWAAEGKFDAWVLVPRGDTGTTALLSHCETIRRVAVVRRNGRLEEVVSYAIMSVYTPAEQRRNGYARHMLRLLHYVLAAREGLPAFPDAWGAAPQPYHGDAAFSVLYSDVGRDFYAQCTQGLERPGWVADSTLKRVFAVPRAPDGEEGQVNWEWLDVAAAALLEDEAAAHLRAEIESYPGTAKDTVAVLPSGGWFRYFPTRAQTVAQAMGNPDADQYVNRTGVRLQHGGWMVYTVETVKDKAKEHKRLVVAHVHQPVSFSDAAAVARAEGASEIELWGGYTGWDKDAPAPPQMKNEDHIPALAAYTLQGTLGDGVEWIWNEHYLWC